MCSTAILILALCCVAVSSQKVEVHVSNVSPDYQLLEFKGDAGTNKIFLIVQGNTDATHVQVKDRKIDELALELGFVADNAIISAVTQPKIPLPLKEDCVFGGSCFRLQSAEKKEYIVNVWGVGKLQNLLTCITDKGRESFGLADTPQMAKLLVKDGCINETKISFRGIPTECEVREAVPIKAITLTKSETCAIGMENCFKNTVFFLGVASDEDLTGDEAGLSGGAIAGIVIGILVFIILIVLGVLLVRRRRNSDKGGDNFGWGEKICKNECAT